MAFTKSLASERSRDITFVALVPWFQIQTLTQILTQTLSNIPNHTLTLTRSQKPNPTEKWSLFSRLAEHWSRDHQKAVFRF